MFTLNRSLPLLVITYGGAERSTYLCPTGPSRTYYNHIIGTINTLVTGTAGGDGRHQIPFIIVVPSGQLIYRLGGRRAIESSRFLRSTSRRPGGSSLPRRARWSGMNGLSRRRGRTCCLFDGHSEVMTSVGCWRSDGLPTVVPADEKRELTPGTYRVVWRE